MFKRVIDGDNTWDFQPLMRYGIQSRLENKYSIRNTEFEIPSKYPVNISYEGSVESIYLG